MADEFDIASDNEIAERERATNVTRHKLQPEVHPAFDGEHCVECSEKMPSTRLFMGRGIVIAVCLEISTTRKRVTSVRTTRLRVVLIAAHE